MVDSPGVAEATTTIVAAQQHYQLIRPIGEGGMGAVFLVKGPERKEPVALKFLQAGMMSESRISAFKREFSLLAELHHPHVCAVYDFGFASSHKQYFFTCEFIEGETLYRALRGAPMDEIERVIVEVLSALDFIHTVGLIHFDIKGANIIVSRIGGNLHAKVVDFGVTSPVDQELKEIAGTLNYMAPELLQPHPQIDPRVDLYSFGIVCYRLLAGYYPYEVTSVAEARIAHQHTYDFALLRSLGAPDHLVTMTQKLMAIDPSERFTSARAVFHFLSLRTGREYSELPAVERAQLMEGPFVGREGTLATVKNAIQRLVRALRVDESIDQEEHPQSYLISGGRGLGKSRLLKEMKYTAQLEDCGTWRVDCEQQGRDLGTFCSALGLSPRDDLRAPDVASQALLDAAKERPTCYLIDNIDRAAPKVQKVLYGLLGLLYSATLAHAAPPLMVIATYTPGEGPPPKAPGTPLLELSALEPDEVEAYVKQLVGQHDDVSDFVESVWNFSSGVPLLMSAIARCYHQGAGELPRSIDELYAKQVQRLPPAARDVLSMIAFSVTPLTAEDITTILGHEHGDALTALMMTGLLRKHQEHQTFSPSTGALGQSLLNGFDTATYRSLADRLFAWLRQRPDYDVSDAAPYAKHLSDTKAAADILDHAITEAEQSGASDQAIEYIELRCQLFGDAKAHQSEILTLQRKIATLRLFQGKYQACEEILHQLAAMQGAPDVEDLKMLGLAKRAQRKPKEAGVFYDQALGKLAADTSNPTYLFLLNERSQAYLEEGATQKSVEMFEQSLNATKQLTKAKRMKVTNNNLGVAYARLGRFDEALAFYEDKLEMFASEKRISASVYGQMGVIHLHAGKIDTALAAFTESWKRSAEMGDQHNALALLDNIITLLQKKASYSEALTFAQQSFQIKASGGTDVDVARSLMTVATLYLNLGLPDLAARYLMQAMRLARKSRNHQLLGWIQITFGYLYKDLGRLMESLNAFEETMAIGETNEDESLVRWGCYGAIDLLVENGELEEARQYLQQLSPLMPKETDPEFKARFAILLHKMDVMKQPHPEDTIGPTLVTLAAQCATNGWIELQWEVEYLIGIFHHKRDETEQALAHIRLAYEIIMGMVATLGDEYREHFTRQKSRARVMADLKTVSRVLHGAKDSQAVSRDQSTIASTSVREVISNEGTFATPPEALRGNTMAQPRDGTSGRGVRFDPRKTLASYEEEILRAAINHYHGDLTEAAKALGLTKKQFQSKFRRYKIVS